jgi:hypothetical protein
MIRTRFSVAVAVFAWSLPGSVLPSIARSAPFITKDFVTVRKGPGPGWSSVTVIPPSTVLNLDNCSSVWSAGWCKITSHGHTGFVRSSALKPLASHHPGEQMKDRAAVPEFLILAQQNYEHAQTAVTAAKNGLERLLKIEAEQKRAAMAKSGSYIEPASLWKEITQAKQNLAYKQKLEAQARAALFNAKGRARHFWAKEWKPAHPRFWPSWWQWW